MNRIKYTLKQLTKPYPSYVVHSIQYSSKKVPTHVVAESEEKDTIEKNNIDRNKHWSKDFDVHGSEYWSNQLGSAENYHHMNIENEK